MNTKIHLDTNYLIDMDRPDSAAARRVRDWLAGGVTLRVDAIAWSEYLCGPLPRGPLPPHVTAAMRRLLGPPLPFGEAEAALAAELFNLGGRRHGRLADCQIAAVAIRAGAALATENPADFTRFAVAGLKLAAA